ncbi:MAG: maltose ABC transporter permease MalF [Anaerolineales bacterium]|nr:maltose ABC transporter permease MalF [Anaerolineales bacterium]
MSESTVVASGASRPLAALSSSLPRIAVRILGLMVVDAFAVYLFLLLAGDGIWFFAGAIAVVTIMVNVINLSERMYPLRWMSPAFTVIAMMVLYPLLFTVYTAFTNYSDGHLLSKVQSIKRITQDTYLPEGGSTYLWTGFRSDSGDILLWLTSVEGQSFLALPDEPLQEITGGEEGIGALDEDGIPQSIEGYTRMEMRDILPVLDSELALLEFGEPPQTFKISTIREAAQLQPIYAFDEDLNALIDQRDGVVYYADEEEGFFTSADGQSLNPGYQVTVGLANFTRLFNSPALRGPFVQVFIWTIVFAFLSVLLNFAMGLFLAIVLNDPIVKGRKFIRTLLILPYAIPGVLGILIWRGMLNPHLGVITTNLETLFGFAPPWFTDQWWAKTGIMMVNLWLGFPYMMLICSGALQSIPQDIYEAADVDGAGIWKKFWAITLPLLLVSVGPLLIAAFTFNFNNFTVIYTYNEGLPPIPGTPTPAGYTDILISYTYRLAFESGRGAQYSYAAAITIMIFLVVATITLFQYRFLGQWEEVSENV